MSRVSSLLMPSRKIFCGVMAAPKARRASTGSLREARVAVRGEDALVGSDHVLAVRQSGVDERAARLFAAHELDDEVDVGRVHQSLGIGAEELFGQAAWLAEVAHHGTRQHQLSTRGRRELLAALGERLGDRAAYRSD